MIKSPVLSLLIAFLIALQTPAVGAARTVLFHRVAAQQKKTQDRDEIKISTELVQIDVLVTDKDNKPVAGLTREDFELYDNKHAQQITSFSYEETDKRRLGPQATETSSLPRVIAAGELKRVIAFVVDTLHIKFENIGQTRKMLEDFVDNKMQPGDLVLILPTGGGSGVLQQFTADRRILHRAIDRLKPLFFSNDSTPYRSFARMGGGPGGQMGTGGRGSGALSMPRGGNVGAMPDPLEEADVRATLNALNETIKAMTRLPGRKVSVLVSEGLRIFATQATSDLDKTTGLAARANVVFYTIDPRGLDPLVLSAGDEIDQEGDLATAVSNASDRKRDDFRESQDSLRAIAADTGGKFFGNNNDIKRGLDAMLDENSAYYMSWILSGGQPLGRKVSQDKSGRARPARSYCVIPQGLSGKVTDSRFANEDGSQSCGSSGSHLVAACPSRSGPSPYAALRGQRLTRTARHPVTSHRRSQVDLRSVGRQI